MIDRIKRGRNVVFITQGGETEGGELFVEIVGQDAGLIWASWAIVDPDKGLLSNHLQPYKRCWISY